VGEVVQVHAWGRIFETTVRSRATRDLKTFSVIVEGPSVTGGLHEFYITPGASRIGMVDQANDRRPFWQFAPVSRGDRLVSLFLLTGDNSRFSGWHAIIPRVGQVVQVSIGNLRFETVVRTRWTPDKMVFFVIVDGPSNTSGPVELYITPTAPGVGSDERVDDLRPWWQVGPRFGQDERPAQIFFLD
jgi:hypothetical protein